MDQGCRTRQLHRSFAEFLGRLGFVSQLLIWMKPHLSPLYAWSAVVSPGTVGRLPEMVILTLRFIEDMLRKETFMVSIKRPLQFAREVFRTDAKCTMTTVVLAGWELNRRRWFSIELSPEQAPFLFREPPCLPCTCSDG